MKRPLGDELLFGALEHGGHATVDADLLGEKLVFSFVAPAPPGGVDKAFEPANART